MSTRASPVYRFDDPQADPPFTRSALAHRLAVIMTSAPTVYTVVCGPDRLQLLSDQVIFVVAAHTVVALRDSHEGRKRKRVHHQS